MTIISGLGPAAPTGRSTGRAGAGRSGFSVPGEARSSGTAGAAATSALSLAGLLALQADDTDTVQDREARRRGRDMLDELNALQRALLGDTVDFTGLRRLATLAADVPAALDPRLRAIVNEITVRAKVELARYGAG
ncbi:flagellar assembly protein FliX [Limobrevibacterium gyesilva]|uniref:Flagellar assembly protein FliX n=1 Tax=Limobrevibacterium gyesilva TaxID=2991712 RepID=A0AA41YTF6_9PROT|nr:flagellar assembly protein FliX [Limobrevibacterium gyesilva]MCW3475122.1 flagellar assembly protein FliX [Limobrevibacterium gyesilva]